MGGNQSIYGKLHYMLTKSWSFCLDIGLCKKCDNAGKIPKIFIQQKTFHSLSLHQVALYSPYYAITGEGVLQVKQTTVVCKNFVQKSFDFKIFYVLIFVATAVKHETLLVYLFNAHYWQMPRCMLYIQIIEVLAFLTTKLKWRNTCHRVISHASSIVPAGTSQRKLQGLAKHPFCVKVIEAKYCSASKKYAQSKICSRSQKIFLC